MEIEVSRDTRETVVTVSVSGAPAYKGVHSANAIRPDSVKITYWDRADNDSLSQDARHQVQVRISGPQIKKDGTDGKVRAEHSTMFQPLPAWVQEIVDRFHPAASWEAQK